MRRELNMKKRDGKEYEMVDRSGKESWSNKEESKHFFNNCKKKIKQNKREEWNRERERDDRQIDRAKEIDI